MAYEGWVPRPDWSGMDFWEDGVVTDTRDFTVAELAAIASAPAEAAAAEARGAAIDGARDALADVLALADLYPAPTPEETALIDLQVAGALSGFRALPDPPADVVALAAAVVSWRGELP